MSEPEEVYPLHNDVYERLTTSQKIQVKILIIEHIFKNQNF